VAVNKVILVGNLGRDPEVRSIPSGQVCNFTLATSDSFTDRAGQRQERTDWHNVVVYGKQAELCGQYLTKGRQVYVEGRISTRQYEAKKWWRYALPNRDHCSARAVSWRARRREERAGGPLRQRFRSGASDG